jgi:hypothetical protein
MFGHISGGNGNKGLAKLFYIPLIRSCSEVFLPKHLTFIPYRVCITDTQDLQDLQVKPSVKKCDC